MPSFDPNRLKQVRKSQISANYSVEHAINKIYGFDAIVEINDNPGYSINEWPYEGKGEKVGLSILELLGLVQ